MLSIERNIYKVLVIFILKKNFQATLGYLRRKGLWTVICEIFGRVIRLFVEMLVSVEAFSSLCLSEGTVGSSGKRDTPEADGSGWRSTISTKEWLGVGDVVVTGLCLESVTTACSSEDFQPFAPLRRESELELATRLMDGENCGLLSLEVGSEEDSRSELLLEEPRLDDGLESLTPKASKKPSVSSVTSN